MDFPEEIKKYVDVKERRISIKTVTMPYIQKNFTYLVHTKLGSSDFNYKEFNDWVRCNVKGYWAVQSKDIENECFFFQQRNDAVMFKLKWGG